MHISGTFFLDTVYIYKSQCIFATVIWLSNNKNLAIANRSRVSCAHNTSTAFYDNRVTFKSRLRVTRGHWKRNHWVDHTRLSISRVIGRWILSRPWNVGQRSLKVIAIGAIWKLGCGFLFAFNSNKGRICSRLWDIQCQRMAWPWKPGYGWRRSIDHRRLSYLSAIVNIALSCTCRVLSLSDCRYSLNPLNQTRIDWVGRYRIRWTFKLSYAWRVRVVTIGVLLRIKYLLTNN